jgi:hypothetical protein
MNAFSYFCIFTSLVLLWAGGRIFITRDLFSSLLTGLLVAGSILAIVARFAPILVREILILFYILGLIKLAYDYRKGFLRVNYNKLLFPALLFCAFYFRYFHFSSYIYEGHDVVYFGPAQEMLNAGYFGNLRVPTIYPLELGANHLLPASTIASVIGLYPSPNLALCIEARYIIIVLFFGNFLVGVFEQSKAKGAYKCFLIFVALAIFGTEIGYNLSISSFIYVFVILQIILLAHNPERDDRALLFFSIMLIAAKAPIFYVAASLGCFYWFYFKHERFAPLTVFAVFLVLGNMLTWVLIPSTSNENFGIMNPFNLDCLKSFSLLGGWTVNDNFKDLCKVLLPGLNLSEKVFTTYFFLMILFFYVVIKYYGVFFVTYLVLFKNRIRFSNVAINGLNLYMLVSLIGWIFIRNGESMRHQAHAYLLASVLAMSGIMFYDKCKKFVIVSLLLVAGFFVLNHDPTRLINDHCEQYRMSLTGKGSLPFQKSDSKKSKEEFYKPEPDEEYWQTELTALMLGLRVKKTDISSFEDGHPSQMRKFVLPQ